MQDEALVGIEGRLAAIGGWSTEETRRQIDSYLAFMAKCGVSETPLPPPDRPQQPFATHCGMAWPW